MNFEYFWIGITKKYLTFSGRARRSEFWFFWLFDVLFTFVFSLVDSFVVFFTNYDGFFSIYSTYQLLMLIPFIAVGVRRMHDVNKSGWFLLIPIYSLILQLTEGTKGENKYGPDPKESFPNQISNTSNQIIENKL
jgi:uncharacterized membrane protein YhaH (DUF805 family)